MKTAALAAVIGLAAIPQLASAQTTLTIGSCDDIPDVISVDTVLELTAPEVSACAIGSDHGPAVRACPTSVLMPRSFLSSPRHFQLRGLSALILHNVAS